MNSPLSESKLAISIKSNMYDKVKFESEMKQILEDTCAFGLCAEKATDKFNEIGLCKPHAVYMNSEWADESQLPVTKQV